MRIKELTDALGKYEPDAVVGVEESDSEWYAVLAVHDKDGKHQVEVEEPCLDCFDHHKCGICQNYDNFAFKGIGG